MFYVVFFVCQQNLVVICLCNVIIIVINCMSCQLFIEIHTTLLIIGVLLARVYCMY